MASLLFASYLIIALSILTIGVVVLINNTSDRLNRTFFGFSLFAASWMLANYFSNDDSIPLYLALIANHAVLFFAGLLVLSLYIFVSIIARTTPGLKHKTLIFLSALVYLATLTPLVVESIEWQENVYAIKFGPLSNLYFLIFFINALAIIIALIYGFRKAKGLDKKRIKFIFWTLATWLLINITTNGVIPLFVGSFNLTSIGPLTGIILVGGLAYTIAKHKLFNIRLLIVRSLGYVLSLGLLVIIFALLSALFIQSIYVTNNSVIGPAITNTVLFVVAVLTYPVLKSYFDRLTNKLFYRDAYDPQEFLDQLNKSIVSNIEIGILLRHTTQIIQDNLKSSFVQIVVPKTEAEPQRIAGTEDIKYTDHEINYMRGRLVGLRQKVVTLDNLSPEEDELRKIMSKHGISILVHLAATSYGQDQTIAFMIFGDKKSGNVYSEADLRIVEIVADELVIAIQNALRFEEIQDFNVTLQSRVNTATNKLRRTNEKLKAIDETKDEFISMASHQLRTPLTSVKGYLSMVLEGDAGEINTEQRKLLDQAYVSSQRMVYLIADLLNVSRLRTGKFVIESVKTNLADLVEGEVLQLKNQAKTKDIELTYTKPADFPDLSMDETKIRQVVMNFIDNAIYYTSARGKIEVVLTTDNNHAYLMVKDNGLGVPKDEQKHLFTKFYRAKNARNIRPDGTGLGLFMAKKVVTAQGGNILFESKEGKGSTFGFSLPLKKLAASGEKASS